MPPQERRTPQTRASEGRPPRREGGASPESPQNLATEFFFILLVIAAVVSSFAAFVQSRQFHSFISQIIPSNSLADYNSPVGDPIVLVVDADVVGELSGTLIDTQPQGARGIVAEGPVLIEQVRG